MATDWRTCPTIHQRSEEGRASRGKLAGIDGPSIRRPFLFILFCSFFFGGGGSFLSRCTKSAADSVNLSFFFYIDGATIC